MKKAYWVVAYRAVTDPEKLQEYSKVAVSAFEAFGGKALVRSAEVTAFEAGLVQRTVVIEFPNLEAAMKAHSSAAYQMALAVLGQAAERDFRIVEGVA